MPFQGDDFVLLEYVLLAGVNDSVEDARRLLALTSDIYCMASEGWLWETCCRSSACACMHGCALAAASGRRGLVRPCKARRG